MPGKRHVNVWTSTRNGQAYFQLIGANGTSADGPSKPYSTPSNAKRAARKLFPGVPIVSVRQRDRHI